VVRAADEIRNETFAKMLLDRTEGVLPASKSELRQVNAKLAAQDLALSKRDDRLQAEIDVLVKELDYLSPVNASNLFFPESEFLRCQARNCFQV
jgi:hypothetical protein